MQAAHLANQALLLNLAPELAERLLELFLISNDDLQVHAILPLAARRTKRDER